MTNNSNNCAKEVLPGTIINGCKVVAKIGSGGMGTVYKAIDESLSRKVAIKIMHCTQDMPSATNRFLREASAIARLDHPSIIKIYSFGHYNQLPFFIMEFVDGWSINDFLNRCRTIFLSEHSYDELMLSGYLKLRETSGQYFLADPEINPLENSEYPRQVRKLMISAATALAEAHSQGIMHRDIKSSNLLISDDQRIKLIDFGLVKNRNDTEQTKTNHFMGTLSYAAPEQLKGKRGEISALTDIYSLGVVMYEMVTLQHPIEGDDPAAIVASICNGEIIPPSSINPHVSDDFEQIILKCLATNPIHRFADANELAKSLVRKKSQSTWFFGFTEILKGWFFKENRPIRQPRNLWLAQQSPANASPDQPDSLRLASLRFLQTARKKFFHNFAILEAIEDLRQAYALAPGDSDIIFLLCFAYNAIGAHSEIKPLFKQSAGLIEHCTDKDQGKFTMCREIFLDRNYEEGLKKAVRLQQAWPDDQDFHFAHFFCLEITGNYSEAIKVGEVLSKLSKKNNVVAVAKSECYFSIMEFDKAINVLKERIKRNPEFHNLRLKRIQAMILSGDLAQAQAETEEGLNKNPLNILMQYYYGRIMVLQNDYDKAYAAFRQSVGLPGDKGLRATGYYSIYRLLELQKKHTAAIKHLDQARNIRPELDFLSNKELEQRIKTEDLYGIREELGNPEWFDSVQSIAYRICADSTDLRSYTIGNHGCISIMIVKENGIVEHHTIFSNFNLYETEELFAQVWLPELPKSPFIDQDGNILTTKFYAQNGKYSGGVASITLAKPWKARSSSHIYCRLSDFKLKNGNILDFPNMPQPALRLQGFVVILPDNLKYKITDMSAENEITYPGYKVYSWCPRLFAGETYLYSLTL